MNTIHRPVVVVTGASSGIGPELAKLAAQSGYDLVAAADEAVIETAAATFARSGRPSMRSKSTWPRRKAASS